MTPTATDLHSHDGTNVTPGANGNLRVPNNKSSPRVSGDPLTLPPGINSEQFHHFISRAETICGKENVIIISDPEQLSHEHYTDPSKVHDMHNIVDEVLCHLCDHVPKRGSRCSRNHAARKRARNSRLAVLNWQKVSISRREAKCIC
jgi:hypothetical protein